MSSSTAVTSNSDFILEIGDPVFALWAPFSTELACLPRPPTGGSKPPPPSTSKPPPPMAAKPPIPNASKPPIPSGLKKSPSEPSPASGAPSLREIEQGGSTVTLSTKRNFNALPDNASATTSSTSSVPPPSSSGSKSSGFFSFLRKRDKEEQFVISTPTNFRQFDVRVTDTKLVSTMTDEQGQEIASPEPNLAGIDEITQGGSSGGGVLGLFKKTEWVKPRVPQISELRNDLQALITKMREMDTKRVTDPDFIDYWSSRPLSFEQWSECVIDVPKQAMEDVRDKGYHFEFGPQCATNDIVGLDGEILLGMEDDYPYYAEMFANQPHENYLFPEVPAIVSVLKLPTFCKVLLRTKKNVERLLIPPDNIPKTLKALPQLKDKKMVKVKNAELAIKELVDYERLEMHVASKFGLVYCKPYEQNEDSLFSAQGGSPEYEEFLDLIGQRVKLLGWEKYRGGLDVKANITGEQSIYSTVHGHEIMFHVCTMLPFVESDEQKVERKRHIGNDVVVLVFKDQGDPTDLFNPAIFRSHFIHCIFIVTPVKGADGTTTHYRLTITNKPGVPPYPPHFPNPAGPDSNLFVKGPEFRDWLLLKMVNAGRAGLNSAEFNSLITARRQKLSFVCEKLQEQV